MSTDLVNSTVTMRDFVMVDVKTGDIVDPGEASVIFGDWLGLARDFTNDIIQANVGSLLESNGRFASSTARKLVSDFVLDSRLSNVFDFKEMCKSEALRLLSSHGKSCIYGG